MNVTFTCHKGEDTFSNSPFTENLTGMASAWDRRDRLYNFKGIGLLWIFKNVSSQKNSIRLVMAELSFVTLSFMWGGSIYGINVQGMYVNTYYSNG